MLIKTRIQQWQSIDFLLEVWIFGRKQVEILETPKKGTGKVLKGTGVLGEQQNGATTGID